MKEPVYKYWLHCDGTYTHISDKDPGFHYDSRFTTFREAKATLVDYFKGSKEDYARAERNARKVRKDNL